MDAAPHLPRQPDPAHFGSRLFLDLTLFQLKKPALAWGWPLALSGFNLGLSAAIAALLAFAFGRQPTLSTLLVGDFDSPEPTALEMAVDSLVGTLALILQAVVLLLVAGAAFRALNSVHASVDFAKIRARFWTIAAASVLKSVAIVAASLLFLVPGILLAGRLLYVQVAAADRGLPLWQAFAESWRLSRPVRWQLTANLAIYVVATMAALIVLAAVTVQVFFANPEFPLWLPAVVSALFWGFVACEYAVFQAMTYHLLVEREATRDLGSDTLPADPKGFGAPDGAAPAT